MKKIISELEQLYPVKSHQAKFLGCKRQNLDQVKTSIESRFSWLNKVANKLGYKLIIKKI